MENGNAKERRIAQELELLKQYQRVSVKDLAATLEVSEMMPMKEKFMTFVWPEFKTSAKKTVLPNTPPR